MKKFSAIIGCLALGVGISGVLRADEASSPASAGPGDTYQTRNEAIWWLEQKAAIAKDSEACGVQAVIEARELLKSREPQVSIDYFNKALYDAKSRSVQREIRMTLSDLYREQGQNDKALDQMQQLMMDQ